MEQRIGSVGGVITLEPAWELPRLSFGTREGWLGLARACGLGLLLTLVQVGLACLLTGKKDPAQAYHHLWKWDGGWYARIIEVGYQLEPVTDRRESNTAFLPAYPVCARWVRDLLGLPTPEALLLTAQAACWGMWTYLLLFFQAWRVPRTLAGAGVVLILCHPAAFFLVAAYTESFFLLSLLGFLWWASRPGGGPALLGGVFGFVMTATRIVGVPLLLFPLVHRWWTDPTNESGWSRQLRKWAQPLFIAVLGAGGVASFLLWCHWELGQWDAYMRASRDGWSVRPNYLSLFSSKPFKVGMPNWWEPAVDPEFLSRLAIPVTVVLFLGLGLLELAVARKHPNSGWRERAGLYFCAWLLFHVPVCTHVARNWSSLLRFSLCVQVVLVLAVVHLLARLWPLRRGAERVFFVLVAGWATVGLALQVLLTYRFTHGMWVA